MAFDAGWSSLVAREAHNLEVVGSNPAPATKKYITPLTYCITWEVFTVSKPLSSIHQSSPD
jgi:hypothetical protein